jgi:branched-subunit amino acid transport protein AzlD
MELDYLLVFIATMAAATFATRALPFLIFKDQQHPVILFLGKYLPPTVMTLLVLYCLKGVNWSGGNHGIPELACLSVVIATHLVFRNALVSIFSGTALYMAWVQGALF